VYEPWRICELELGEPLTGISPVDPETGKRYERAQVLVRLHGIPVGVVRLALPRKGLLAEAEAEVVGGTLGREIADHLRRDGLPDGEHMTVDGFPPPTDGCPEEGRRLASDSPHASVVITTRDRTRELARCLESIFAMRYPRFDVIVVDNAPSDLSTESMLRERFGQREDLVYVREDGPGIAVARNAGIRRAQGEFIAFTDDDVIVDPEWLSWLAAGFATTPRAACVTGLTMPAALDLQVHEWFEEYGGFDKGLEPRVFDLASSRSGDDPLFPYAPGKLGSGNNMAFRTDVLKSWGAFDPCLGIGSPTHSGEDLAAFIRLLWGGWQLVYQPTALVWHHHRDTYDGLRRQVYGYGVGLSACMLSCLSRRPEMIPDFLARVPPGIRYLVSPSSPKNRRRTISYPRHLAFVEMAGMAYGPIAYARARIDRRARARRATMERS
jgi:GT2 family glycosyltransferase